MWQLHSGPESKKGIPVRNKIACLELWSVRAPIQGTPRWKTDAAWDRCSTSQLREGSAHPSMEEFTDGILDCISSSAQTEQVRASRSFQFSPPVNCAAVLQCCYAAVLLYCCAAVLLYCCAAVLLYCSAAVLLYCSAAVLLYCSAAVLLYCSAAVLLYCCTAVLQCCCTPVLLYCSAAVLTSNSARTVGSLSDREAYRLKMGDPPSWRPSCPPRLLRLTASSMRSATCWSRPASH